jgi:hypothetical protein
MGFEPTTSSLGSWHSTTELRPPLVGPLLFRILSCRDPEPASTDEPVYQLVVILIGRGQSCKAFLEFGHEPRRAIVFFAAELQRIPEGRLDNRGRPVSAAR